MSNRPRSSLFAGTLAALGLVGSGLGAIGSFFANAILAPSNWQSGTQSKRSRRGSYKRSNPEGYAARDRDGEKSSRPRFLRAAPSWRNPNALMARGNPVHAFRDNGARLIALPSNHHRDLDALYGVGAFIETKARPHGSKAENQARFLKTPGNHPGKGKRLRAALRRAEARGDVIAANSTRSALSRL